MGDGHGSAASGSTVLLLAAVVVLEEGRRGVEVRRDGDGEPHWIILKGTRRGRSPVAPRDSR